MDAPPIVIVEEHEEELDANPELKPALERDDGQRFPSSSSESDEPEQIKPKPPPEPTPSTLKPTSNLEVVKSKQELEAENEARQKKASKVLSQNLDDLRKLEYAMDQIGDDYSLSEVTTGSNSSSDGEDEEYVPPPVGKLRALARVLMINLRWMKDIRKTHEHDGFESSCMCPTTGQRKRVFFKVADFMASKRIISGLTEQEKLSLKLHPIARTPDDVENILKILERYNCFDKFTPEVKKKLAVWARYDTFDDGRVLFKASETDSRTGRTNLYPLGVRGPSSIIGEIELLNVDERRSTGVTQGDVELLRVDEDPFNEILRTSFETMFDERFATLRHTQTFESWTDAELKILNENSSVISFEENKPILSDVFGPSAFSYLIRGGRCSMVKDVIFERSFFGEDFRNPMYQALDPEDERRWTSPSKLKEHHELEGHHLHITEFKEGDYFGVGENLRRAHIISLTAVECLTIPRSVFEKAKRNQFLEDLKADLEDAIPSDEQILDEWLALQSWNSYKEVHLRRFWGKVKAEETAKFFNMHRKHRLNKLTKK